MKKRRVLLTFLALLLIVGIPTGFLVREVRHEQASRELIAAIKADNANKAIAALKAGADPNARDHTQDPALNTGEQLKQLINKILHPDAIPNPDENFTTLLLSIGHRSREGNPLLTGALLDAGADPNLSSREEELSPLMEAAYFSSPQAVALLLRHGGDPHQRDKRGQTALHYAIICAGDDLRGDIIVTMLDILALLLDAGADINAKDHQGYTPLCWASKLSNEQAVQILLQRHADPDLSDDEGKTALDRATGKARELLRKAGARANAPTDAERDAEIERFSPH